MLSAFEVDSGFIGFWATWPAEPVRGFMISDRVPRTRFVEWYRGDTELHLVFPPDLTARIERDYTERGVFGVPMFITADGARFWGHDRMEWALRQGLIG